MQMKGYATYSKDMLGEGVTEGRGSQGDGNVPLPQTDRGLWRVSGRGSGGMSLSLR